ncbi:hypothetical protein [Enhydrobacter aerosaccus]|uniref:hypothetical protein n=1 Tax=Enhydrobacter aerosaccus TaxID=225324 RepID=UPI001482AED1|nr:hypothetical protein [Enhydrobacter aerosaccus]
MGGREPDPIDRQPNRSNAALLQCPRCRGSQHFGTTIPGHDANGDQARKEHKHQYAPA